jgi:Uma2 family endonuclease
VVMTMHEHETRTAAEEARVASTDEAFEAMSAAAPEGWRVELIEGEIHVMPPANGQHEEFVSEMAGQVRDHRKDLRSYTGLGLRLSGLTPSDKVIPDLVIAPRGSFDNDAEYQGVEAVLLVGEVTSKSTGDNDRGRKLRAYARSGIPCYLLVDREKDTVTLLTRPSGERYLKQVSVAISEKLALPDPLGFALDTSEF